MGSRRFHLVLDEDLVLISRERLRELRGTDNLSQFVNEFLEEFALGEDTGHDQARRKVRELAAKKRQEINAQRKIVSESEAIQAEATEYQQKRMIAVEDACLKTFVKYRDFGKYLPENDPDFLYVDTFNRTVSEISQMAGYDVDNIEVIGMWHKKARTRQVGSQETDETVFGIMEGGIVRDDP